MNEPWHITLFGGLSARQGDKVITRFKSQKVASLVAYLALHLRQTHSREFLIELLWPERSLEAGRNNLSVSLSSLRHQFEPPGVPANSVIRADRFSISLNPIAVTTDVFAFEQGLKESARGQSERERAEQLARAVELYQGRLLPQLYDEWIAGEQERLASLFFDATARLIPALETAGKVESALSYARRAVFQEPLREEAQHTLIRLLDKAGQPGVALRQFKEFERLLEEKRVAQPSAPLRALARQIEKRTGLIADAPAAPPVPAAIRPQPVSPSKGPSTVTFLMTDIEGSTRSWESSGDAYKNVLQEHHGLLREAFRGHGGHEVSEAGDGFIVAFAGAVPALRCAVAAQQALSAHSWPEVVGGVGVRMALHSGDVEQSGVTGEYQGLVLHRASRVLSAAHGGQTLLSAVTAELVVRDLPPEVSLLDLGVFRLRDLPTPERLFQVEHPGRREDTFPPLRAQTDDASSGVPLTFTRFFGRERELARLQELIGTPDRARLLTVVGPGGNGKSRLSIEAARRASAAFSGAVWFVSLADLSDPGRIAGAILDSLRVPRSPRQEPLEQVVPFLSRQRSLLVLDNFEQLVERGGPKVVQTLLEGVPALTILVTSRQVLGLSAEQEFVLSPLPTPRSGADAQALSAFDSVQLFIDRAQQVKPDFQVTNYNAAAVAELVTRLEGIPLAIELAAARAQVLTPSQMLAQLENRFTFLAGRKRDVVERHRTLYAAVDWSFQLLSPELQRFFGRLSVFRGGWTVEAAESVCEEPLALDYLAQLGECSLVLPEETEQGMRFRMLETLREFAWEQVSAEARTFIERRHFNFFLNLAVKVAPKINGPEQATILTRLEAEHENLRSVLNRCNPAQDSAEESLVLVGALYWFWTIRGHIREGRAYTERMLSATNMSERTTALGTAQNSAGNLAFDQGDYVHARMLLEASLATARHLGDTSRSANALNNLGNIASALGDQTAAGLYYEEALALSREAGDAQQAADNLMNLAGEAHYRGDWMQARTLCREAVNAYREVGNPQSVADGLVNLGTLMLIMDRDFTAARSAFEESLGIFRELRDKHGIAQALGKMGATAHIQKDYEEALMLYEESLLLRREMGDKLNVASTLEDLGNIARVLGDYEKARALLTESLVISHELDAKPNIAFCLEFFARLGLAQKQIARATRLYGAAEALRITIGRPLTPAKQEENDRDLALLRDSVGGDRFTILWAEGEQMGWERAVALALEETHTKTAAQT